MANGSVVVYDIDSLEKFGMELAARSAELESLYNALTVSCAAQETNWHDPAVRPPARARRAVRR